MDGRSDPSIPLTSRLQKPSLTSCNTELTLSSHMFDVYAVELKFGVSGTKSSCQSIRDCRPSYQIRFGYMNTHCFQSFRLLITQRHPV